MAMVGIDSGSLQMNWTHMFFTMLGDLAVFWLYVTLICSFLHYIKVIWLGLRSAATRHHSTSVNSCNGLAMMTALQTLTWYLHRWTLAMALPWWQHYKHWYGANAMLVCVLSYIKSAVILHLFGDRQTDRYLSNGAANRSESLHDGRAVTWTYLGCRYL